MLLWADEMFLIWLHVAILLLGWYAIKNGFIDKRFNDAV